MNKIILNILICCLLNLTLFNSAISQAFPSYSSPEEQGINTDIIEKLSDTLAYNGALIIYKSGKIILEEYSEQYPAEYKHHIHSCTKSVTSMLFGIAIDKGLAEGENTLLGDYYSEYLSDKSCKDKSSIPLWSVLSMSSGIEWHGGIGGKDLLAMLESQDWVEYLLSRPLAAKPGEVFVYNSAGTQLLSDIIQRKSGIKTKEFARVNLFEPIGIKNFAWSYIASPKGVTPGAWGLNITALDLLRLGCLMLNEGKWEDRQLIDSEWVNKSTEKHMKREGRGFGYGYQWWISNNYDGVFQARGWYGEHYALMTILKEQNMIILLAGERPKLRTDDIIGNYLIPSIR